ncbi:helicase associated domain-containing protein [Embleya sp. NPDC001921]
MKNAPTTKPVPEPATGRPVRTHLRDEIAELLDKTGEPMNVRRLTEALGETATKSRMESVRPPPRASPKPDGRSAADLTPAQRAALAKVGVDVTEQDVQPAAPASAARVDRWTLTLAAAAAFREREGHLTVPRKHVEAVEHDGETHPVKLGVALANGRQRRATYPPEQLDALSALDMRWT